MSTSTGIFSDEWRECLVAHYTSVLRAGDKKTERTLQGVLLEAGFTTSQLREITVRATAHVDDVNVDFVPDLQIFASASPQAAPEPLIEVVEALAEEALAEAVLEQPQEVIEALAQPEAEIEAETAPVPDAESDDVPLADSETDDEPPPPDDPGITQLSLF